MGNYIKHHRYSKILAAKVCERLSNGESLNLICRDISMPSRKCIYNWLRMYPEFMQQYVLARDLQAEMFAEQIIDLADSVDVTDTAQLNKVKLQIDARKWYASKVSPRKFSDALIIDSNVNTQKLQINLSPEQAYQKMLSDDNASAALIEAAAISTLEDNE